MNKKIKQVIIVLILGILLGVLFIIYGHRIPCIFHEITGLHCPGCGGTRAIVALYNRNLYQAFRYNMIIVILLPFFILHCILRYIFKLKYKIPNWTIYVLIVVALLFGILRNIPYFSYLAPTVI